MNVSLMILMKSVEYLKAPAISLTDVIVRRELRMEPHFMKRFAALLGVMVFVNIFTGVLLPVTGPKIRQCA